MPKNKGSGHELPQTRSDWKEVVKSSDFLLNMPEWYVLQVEPMIPAAFDREWVIAVFCPDHEVNTLLGYVHTDGGLEIIGCLHCLDKRRHRMMPDNVLFIDGMPAIPFHETLGQNSIPEGMHLFEIEYLRLFLCPFCRMMVKDWGRGILQDPTMNMSPQEREDFLDANVRR